MISILEAKIGKMKILEKDFSIFYQMQTLFYVNSYNMAKVLIKK
jgi:hypothetical protein